MKKLLLLLLPTIAFAQPKAIHYSSVGDYLVDENGHRTTITGHPTMTCYKKYGKLTGTLQKVRGMKIWLIVPTIPPGGDLWYVEIDDPVCDLKNDR